MVSNPKRGLADKYNQCVNWNSTRGFTWNATLNATAAFSWTYNWGTALCPDIPINQWVPMIRTHVNLAELMQDNTTLPPRPHGETPRYILGFNEPNQDTKKKPGKFLTPQDAAKLWPNVEFIAKRWGIPKIGAPVPAGCNHPHSLLWAKEFLGNCTGCQIDFMTVHYYDCNVTEFKKTIDTFSKLIPEKKVWATEFNCHLAKGPLKRQMDYMKEAVPMLDAHPAVERYAWMAGEIKTPSKHWASLFAVSKKGIHYLTELGKLYLSL